MIDWKVVLAAISPVDLFLLLFIVYAALEGITNVVRAWRSRGDS